MSIAVRRAATRELYYIITLLAKIKGHGVDKPSEKAPVNILPH